MKKLQENVGSFMKNSYLCNGLYVDPRFACPNFSGILEALCSFLQAENLRTFQIA